MTRPCRVAVCWLLLSALPAAGQVPPFYAGDAEPVLRVEAGGMTSNVAALAFGPADGRTLYAAGWDKVVRAWALDADGRRALDPAAGVRVPLGPGADGALNALALSADGRWLAAAGWAVVRDKAGFRQPGVWTERKQLRPEQWEDAGTIYLVDTRDRSVRRLRGHKGTVVALAFAPARPEQPRDEPPSLVSASQEWDAKAEADAGRVIVWDTARGVPLREYPEALPDPFRLKRPGLAVTRLGPRPDELRVALAWEDGRLRVWEVSRAGKPPAPAEDGSFNIGLAALPGTGQLLTCSFQAKEGVGRLQLWDVAAGQAPRPDPKRVVRFVPTGEKAKMFYSPLEVALVASRPGGLPDHAAVILRRVERTDKQQRDAGFELRVVALGEQFGAEQARLFLWPATGTLPVMAATPDGSTLAVAGSGNHEVRVYSVADLLGRRENPRQVLASAGTAMQSVAFARHGADLGLVLNAAPKEARGRPPEKPRRGDLFLHFGKAALEGEAGGWKIESPSMDGWKVEMDEPSLDGRGATKPWRITVWRGAKPGRAVELKHCEGVFDYALLPPRPGGHPVPLLAVSFRAEGQPYLWLFDAATGAPLRQCTGHDGFIRAVAFAADGRLLASAADDQMVCVWSLTDLDPGAASAAGRPAMDERKPLATLFLAREERTGAWDWLGWNPTGPYDSSGPRGERYLGWHRNPQRPAELPAFVPVRQYQQEYHFPGVLKHLVAEGTTELGLKAWEEEQRRKQPPPPRVTVRVGDVVVNADRDRALLRQPPRSLRLAVHEFPADQVESVAWRLESQGVQGKLERVSDQEWSADLSAVAWRRGDSQVRLVLRTRERLPRDFIEDVRFRYLPPAPEVVTFSPLTPLTGLLRVPPLLLADTSLAGRWVVDRPQFSLQALAVPAPGRAVEVQVLENGRPRSPSRQPFVHEPLKLQEGYNLIRVVAVHTDALPNPDDAEKAELAVEVFYRPPAPPPEVLVDAVITLPGGGGQPVKLPREVGKAVALAAPRVRIEGRVRSKSELKEWGLEATGPDKLKFQLALAPKGEDEWSFTGVLTLEPGRWQLRPWFRTDKHKAEADIPVVYQPLLPRLAFIPPPGGLDFYDDEGKGPPAVPLRFQLTPPRDPEPYPYQAVRAAVRVNDEELAEKPALDPQTHTLTIRVPLRARENRVRVVLRGWEAVEESREVVLRYLRPPRVESLTGKPADDKPFADFVARVLSPADLPLEKDFVRATVGDRQVPAGNITVKPEAGAPKGKLQPWEVRLQDVSLDLGMNEVRLWVRNAEAEALRSPTRRTVEYKRKAEPPEVRLLDPAAEFTVSSPEPVLKFQVISKSPLKDLVLVREDEQAFRQPLNPAGAAEVKLALRLSAKGRLQGEASALEVAKLPRDRDGFHEARTECRLQRGVNRLRLVAVNDGGERYAAVVVNYLPPPARLVLEGLAGQPGGVPVAPRAEPGGRLRVPPASQSRVWLRGKVLWDDAPDARVRHALVYVNGLRQGRPARLEPAGDVRTLRFETEVHLGRAADNHVEVELPGVKLGEDNRQDFVVDCQDVQPPAPRLHLLLIAPGEREAAALERRVLQRLNASEVGPRQFRLGAQEGRLYAPLIDTADPRNVYELLLQVRMAIEKRALQGPSADVVLIYFQGREQIGPEGHRFSLRPPADEVAGELAIRYDDLAAGLGSLPGAQLLLLDVMRPTSLPAGAVDLIARADEQVRVGALRAAWLGRSPAPDEVRLLEALRAALPRAARLEEVDTLLRDRYTQAGQKYPEAIRYDPHIPRSLRGLVISGNGRP